MSVNAGGISVNISAGTAQMIVDLESAKGKIREFGASGPGAMAPTSAAIRVLEGNIFSANRAVARFVSDTLGAGKLMEAAFPVIGAVAFGAAVFETGKKVYDFWKSLQELPEKANAAFSQLNGTLHTQNDELDLANAKLEQDINKLEGKRTNNLAIMLSEVKVQADKLGESLDKDVASLNKLLKDQDVSFLQRLFGGGQSTDQLQKFFGGQSGVGGSFARLEQINNDEAAALDKIDKSAKDAQAQATAITNRFNAQRLTELNAGRSKLVSARDDAAKQPTTYMPPTGMDAVRQALSGGWGAGAAANAAAGNKANLEKLNHDLTVIDEIIRHYSTLVTNQALTAKKDDLTEKFAEASPQIPVNAKIQELKDSLAGIQEKTNAIGQGTFAVNVATGAMNAAKTIDELNKKLAEHHIVLTAVQKDNIKDLYDEIALATTEETWKQHVDNLNRSLDDRIKSQREMTAALSAGYDATRQTFIDTQMAGVRGQYGDDWMKAHPADVSNLQNKYGSDFDAQHQEQQAKTVQGLSDQINLETRLAAVVTQGIDAVHNAEMAEKAIELSRTHTKDETEGLIKKEEQLYQLRRLTASNKAVGDLKAQTAGIDRLKGAAFGGEDAIKQQELLNKYAEMQRQGATDAQIQAEILKDVADEQRSVTDEAAKMVTHYSDQLTHLKEIQDALEKQKTDQGDSLALDIALRDVENERLKILVQQTLQIGTAQAGLKAFFLAMQEQAKTAAQIVYDTLNSAVDKLSDQFANLLSGKKTNFKQMFQDLAHNFEQESIKSGMQQGLGALGKVIFGTADNPLSKMAAGKPDGTSEDKALWVRFQQQQQGGANGGLLGGLLGKGGPLGLGRLPQMGSEADEGSDDGSDSSTASGLGSLAHILGSLGKSAGSDDSGDGSDSTDSSGAAGGVGTLISILGALGKGFGGGYATGGDIDPSHSYMVGEYGPEMIVPRGSSTVVPNNKLGGNGAGDGGNTTINVNAPGSELGAHSRIAAAVTAAHNAAVQDSIRTIREEKFRTPKR